MTSLTTARSIRRRTTTGNGLNGVGPLLARTPTGTATEYDEGININTSVGSGEAA